MLLATLFVTMPFVARELLPILDALDPAEEEAAKSLGGWRGAREARARLCQRGHCTLLACGRGAARAEGQPCDPLTRPSSPGASDWEVFWNVTVPNIRWGLLYGIILTNAVSEWRAAAGSGLL